ncbi:MAG: DNA-processing protein DprA [Planctomycetes bacterium]|nr:DNA-processing protein DprA [Planctomycetota bacterium]
MAELPENLIRLKTVPGIGNAILWRLLQEFGGSDGIFGASVSALAGVRGMTPEKARLIIDAQRFDPRPEMEKAVRAGVDIIPYDFPSYPKPLLHSFDPPAVLYVRGRLSREDQVAIGIVGTRRASPYGRDSALSLASALARGGYTVVSGLALGIDTFAHLGALNAGGRTIGVLGCGFDHMYPGENRDLALEMTRNGAVVSEFPMATSPSRDTFPTRNRIIAGMSLGLVVVEAPLRSGALITAKIANEIGRTVFALPGRMGDAGSEGCNKLIRDGASVVTSADAIFAELNPTLPLPEMSGRGSAKKAINAKSRGRLFEKAPLTAGDRKSAGRESPAPKAGNPAPNPKLNDEQRLILSHLTGEWQTVDELTGASEIPAGRTSAALALLRLVRLAEQGPGQTYRLRNP